MSGVHDAPDEQSSVMFSPIKVITPPPPSNGRKSMTRKQLPLQLDLDTGSPLQVQATPVKVHVPRACISCGRKRQQCKCIQTRLAPPVAAAAAAKDELWHLDVDNWQSKHSKPSSPSDYFNVREKAALRRWFESLSHFSQGSIPSDDLIFQLISSNIINDEKGLRMLLQNEKSPLNFTFCGFMALLERRQTNAQYRRQLKHLVALTRPKSKGGQILSVPVVVAERRRKKLLDSMIEDTVRRQGEVDSIYQEHTDKDSHAYANISEKQQKRHQQRLERRQLESKKEMDSYINTVKKVIDDDKNAFMEDKKLQKLAALPTSLRQKTNKKRSGVGVRAAGYNFFDELELEDDGISNSSRSGDRNRGFPPPLLAPVVWGEHGLEMDTKVEVEVDLKMEKENEVEFGNRIQADVDANAKTISRLIPPPRNQKQQQSLSRARHPLRKQKSFDQLVLTKQKSFHRLHVQRRDSFGPRVSCNSSDDEDYHNDDDDDYVGDCDGGSEGAVDIFDQLDRQILERNRRSEKALVPLPAASAAVLQVSPVKRPSRREAIARRHHYPSPSARKQQTKLRSVSDTDSGIDAAPHPLLSNDSSTPNSGMLHLPGLSDLSPPPPKRGHLSGPRVNCSQRCDSSKPFTPVDSAAKQRREEAKMKVLVTPQDNKIALKASKKQGRRQKGSRPHNQLVGSVSTHSFESCSSSKDEGDPGIDLALHPPSKEFGVTLYDFIQNME